MCEMTNCDAEPERYVVIKTGNKNEKRIELCIKHVELAHQLAEAKLTHIVEYGALGGGPRWKIQGGK